MDYTPLDASAQQAKPATAHTQAAQRLIEETLPFSDRQSFVDAQRGFIATLDPLTLSRPNGQVTYDLSQMEFLRDEAPDTVNPSLWRQAQLNALYNGLYEVADGLYQVRSFDIANMTLIRGEKGWVIIDPLTSSESSQAALALANEHLGERPVSAVIITHSHADHFAGVLGVVSAQDVASGKVPLIAPQHFVQEALSENVLAGNVMGRRATYMYGNLLQPGPQAFVSTGLGAALSMGSTGFIVPSDFVCETGETRTLDGITFEFQMTPGTEAPAEFVFFLPQFKALCMAEITSHHLHNVYTLRGAQVRDALAWSAQIRESIDLFGDRLEIQFACHHWPIWGQEAAVEYLQKQSDLYKYIHDQTLRLANKGYTKEEIAERVSLPDALGHEFYNRGYYGSLHHNVRAVYVKYLGYFNGNPATLHTLPPTDAAFRYVEAMGGADRVVSLAQSAYEQGDYRWVGELLNHVMMVDPQQFSARALLADALEQMGYQAESAVWRNFYLCGALELREGLPKGSDYKASEGMARGMPLANLFQVMAVRLLPGAADGLDLAFNLTMTDSDECWLMTIKHSVLNAYPGKQSPQPTASIATSSVGFKRLMMGLTDAAALMDANDLEITGNVDTLAQLNTLFDSFPRRFPIMTPRPA
jgi:alkyl sulfatase BDS1-like metallo-beta-lactamase superfamily hydrolase